MHVADVTMFYAAEGGGVRRYLTAKREWLRAQPDCRHTLVVPEAQRFGARQVLQGARDFLGDARGFPSDTEEKQPARKDARSGMLPLASIPLPFSHGYRLPLARRAAAEAIAELAPDVIEAGDPYRLAWAALDAGRAARVPVVAFCHSDLPRLVARWGGHRAERVAEAYLRRLYSRFTCVLAPSRTLVRRLRSLGIRASYQPLGVDTGVFTPARRSGFLRQRLGLAEDARLLIYVGRFAPEKNLDVLCAALDRLAAPYLLLAVGGGPSAPAHPRIRVLPFVAQPAMLAELIAACDAFVHAGDEETFGLGALEAMACGVPVVGARAAGIAELVGARAGILVPPRDPEALAEGIDALWQQDRAELGASARRRAESYDWNRVLPHLLARYRLLARRAAN